MHYIIKRVPRIQPTNKFGVPNKTTYTWDYKNTTYLKENGEWTRDKYSARVFEGTWNDARSEAARAKICCSDPNDHEFVGPVEAVLNEDGTIERIEEKQY